MACEYSNYNNNKCELTNRNCFVDVDVDKTAYRHCLRREWKAKLDDRHSVHLQRPCSALDDLAPQVAQNGLFPTPACVPITCEVCQLRLGLENDRGLDALILEVHQRIYHPDMLTQSSGTLTTPPPSLTNF